MSALVGHADTETLHETVPVLVGAVEATSEVVNEPPLVVDLDGSLCRSDTLHETLLALLKKRPAALLAFLRALPLGKAASKSVLAQEIVLDGNILPYNEDVLRLVVDARAKGRRTVLVSAAHQQQVDIVAKHLDLFDEAYGTGCPLSDRNLRGEAKADLLLRLYGARNFDYVGDSRVDIEVWAHARKAITVAASKSLREATDAVAPHALHISSPTQLRQRLRPYLKVMRPHQWSKNLLVFLPVLASHELTLLPLAVAAFVAFSLTASAVYICNDLLDIEADRAHPRKRARPFAAGTLPISHGLLLAGGLIGAAGAFSLFFMRLEFAAVLILYFIATCFYSFSLKRKLLIDIVALSMLYVVRVVAGAAATGLELSPWLLVFSMFTFFSLAALKRQAELVERAGASPSVAFGRAYSVDDLPVIRSMAVTASQCATLVFALYINSHNVYILYKYHELLWIICPILLYWLARMIILTHRGYMNDDPIVFAFRDRISWFAGLLILGILMAARGL